MNVHFKTVLQFRGTLNVQLMTLPRNIRIGKKDDL